MGKLQCYVPPARMFLSSKTARGNGQEARGHGQTRSPGCAALSFCPPPLLALPALSYTHMRSRLTAARTLFACFSKNKNKRDSAASL